MTIEKKFNLVSLTVLLSFLGIHALFYITPIHLSGVSEAVLCFAECASLLIIALVILNRYVSKTIVSPLKKIYDDSSLIIAEGKFERTIDIETGNELESLSDNFNKMAAVLQTRIDMLKTASEKEQDVIRSLSMLNEMMGFITSELKFETIIQTFLEMAKSLLKVGHSGIFIFEGEKRELKLFKTTMGKDNNSLDCARAMLQGPIGDVIKTLNILRVNDVSLELPLHHDIINNFMVIPLTLKDNRLSGLLMVANKEGGFTQDDEDTLFNFSFQAFYAISIHEEIARHAVTDGLTGISNHRVFQEKLSEEIGRAGRYSKPLSLIMLDIDHFKSFNDIYGHQTGDAVLKKIANIISANIRTVDFPARYGGEEFIVILPETGYGDTKAIAERIRLKVGEQPFTTETGESVNLTISGGISSYPVDSTIKEDLIKKADQALYFAKNHGRNKICIYQETIMGMLQEIPKEFDSILRDPDLKDIETIAKGIDSKSDFTKNHSIEVASYAVILGKQIRLDSSQLESLRIASMLHDIGNIGIPEHILNKPGPLTPEEKSIIQGHPGLAEMILRQYPHTDYVLPIILYHHERFDGKGYPLGLKGEEIPLLARILSVIEAYQAMISPRPYRRRITKDEVIAELKKEAGSQFDPMVVNAFINLLSQIFRFSKPA
jgi:diguanylate cyclase (GGDEF)-like protein